MRQNIYGAANKTDDFSYYHGMQNDFIFETSIFHDSMIDWWAFFSIIFYRHSATTY